jgi:hypothetical protein
VVRIDCRNTLLAGVSLRALKEMDLQEGVSIGYSFPRRGKAGMGANK